MTPLRTTPAASALRMAYEIVFSAEAERDFQLIFDFLVDAHCAFGDDMANAIDQAEQRVMSIRADIDALAVNPHRGTRHDDMLPGLRHVTLGRAIIWFDIVDAEDQVRVLAVFFGGQDHRRRMLIRLLER